ncbi:hypothetical protein KC19_VG224700 [Ceratodon purpureus]|uniref:Reverse transcriptase zinc-binding domain-containing protein n=1 Tax=Ceratodon purpureus TaxID=3225 RepID=A0A8T0HTA1_CERPU|nr:hypothetical protein KC19_VG224700 [Ceratodon purpureus]
MQKQEPMRLTFQLIEQGYNTSEQTRIFQRIWHTWRPRKVAAMNKLTLGGGLPVGEWRKKIGDAGSCRMCNDNRADTPQHSLVTCSHVNIAWQRYNDTRSTLDSTLLPLVWPQYITDLIDPLGTPLSADTFTWDSQGRTKIDMNTPWDILRSCLLKFIWCQRCRYELNNHPFHLGAALLNAWRTTIYIGMEAELEIEKYKKPERCQAMTDKLTEIWSNGNIFANRGATRLAWMLLPPERWLTIGDAVKPDDTELERESDSDTGDPSVVEPQDTQLQASITELFKTVRQTLAERLADPNNRSHMPRRRPKARPKIKAKRGPNNRTKQPSSSQSHPTSTADQPTTSQRPTAQPQQEEPPDRRQDHNLLRTQISTLDPVQPRTRRRKSHHHHHHHQAHIAFQCN